MAKIRGGLICAKTAYAEMGKLNMVKILWGQMVTLRFKSSF